MADFTHGKILPLNIEDEMKKSYIEYAMSVIVGRALPDVRDGLKPVHRRILYSMYERGITPDKPYKKSARIVGDVLGKYHPHGDTSIYDAMVRLAQDFSTRYLLVDGHGNFGSVDGDSAAAMRYTEVRMSQLAMEMLAEINKDTVNFTANYDATEEEPSVLPARYPNLLVNGSSGIAVGMATNIPPHNLGEVIDGVIALIDDADIEIEDLAKIIKGPDFPTGAMIMGRQGIRSAYLTGRGSVVMRSKTAIERLANGKARIIVSELPYQVNKAKLVEKIADLVKDKKIEGITDLRDESDRTGMRVLIELRRDVNPHVLLNQLYKHTQLQESFGINMRAIVNGEALILNLKQVLYHYLEHQKIVIRRRTQFDLNKAEARAHIVEGLKIALNNLEEVIKVIRSSKNVEVAKISLMEKFSLSEKQAIAILEMRLSRLTALEIQKLEDEYKELIKTIALLTEILANERLVLNIIKEEITKIKVKYGDERRTVITSEGHNIDEEDLIAEEDMVITITHNGYIKRLNTSTYNTQKRGGKGITAMTTKEEDFVEHLFITTTHHYLVFFTNRGKCYRVKVHELPEVGRQAKGTALINLIPVTADERINAVIPVKEYAPDMFLFMATKKGIVKKTVLKDYDSSRKDGLIAINLEDDDEVIGVKLTNGSEEIFLGTFNGLTIRFSEKDVRFMGRTTHGVKGITLRKGDYVVGMDVIKPGSEVLIITENGFGKRTPVKDYRLQNRGGKGIIGVKVTERNGNMAAIKITSADEELMIISHSGVLIRIRVDEVSESGRSTQGVIVMRFKDGIKVAAVAKVAIKEEEE